MRTSVFVVVALGLAVGTASAQIDRGYVEGGGGFASSTGTTSGNGFAEVGVRVSPHVRVFGDIGKFGNVQASDLQSSVDAATALLATNDGISVVGTAHQPAWYGLGGLRVSALTHGPVQPYFMGGVGWARLSPTAEFTYTSGTFPDVTPSAGDDVTSEITSMGVFAQPAAYTAFTWALGGGAEFVIHPRVVVDAGYRFSRVSADTPFNTNGMTVGLGLRF